MWDFFLIVACLIVVCLIVFNGYHIRQLRYRIFPAPWTKSSCVCVCVCMRAHMHTRLVTQPWLTLCNSMDCSPPGFSVHGIFQARILERLPFPPPRDLPDPGMEPTYLSPPALADGFFTPAPPGKSSSAGQSDLGQGFSTALLLKTWPFVSCGRYAFCNRRCLSVSLAPIAS